MTKKDDNLKVAWDKKGEFILDNWNDTLCNEVRELVEDMTMYGSYTYGSGRLSVKYKYYADQKYYFITDIQNQFLYIISWYKSRGRTSCVLFQGEIIDKKEMEELRDLLLKERGNKPWQMK